MKDKREKIQKVSKDKIRRSDFYTTPLSNLMRFYDKTFPYAA